MQRSSLAEPASTASSEAPVPGGGAALRLLEERRSLGPRRPAARVPDLARLVGAWTG